MNFWSLFSHRRRLHEQAAQANDINAEIPVYFQVEWEAIPKSEAQGSGVFMPSMADPHTPGGPALKTSIRPSYRGPFAAVWKCTLWWNLIPVQARPNPTDWPEGTHRLVFETRADSREEAGRLMAEQIRDHFFGMLQATRIADFNAGQFDQVNRQRNQLADWITHDQGVQQSIPDSRRRRTEMSEPQLPVQLKVYRQRLDGHPCIRQSDCDRLIEQHPGSFQILRDSTKTDFLAQITKVNRETAQFVIFGRIASDQEIDNWIKKWSWSMPHAPNEIPENGFRSTTIRCSDEPR